MRQFHFAEYACGLNDGVAGYMYIHPTWSRWMYGLPETLEILATTTKNGDDKQIYIHNDVYVTDY